MVLQLCNGLEFMALCSQNPAPRLAALSQRLCFSASEQGNSLSPGWVFCPWRGRATIPISIPSRGIVSPYVIQEILGPCCLLLGLSSPSLLEHHQALQALPRAMAQTSKASDLCSIAYKNLQWVVSSSPFPSPWFWGRVFLVQFLARAFTLSVSLLYRWSGLPPLRSPCSSFLPQIHSPQLLSSTVWPHCQLRFAVPSWRIDAFMITQWLFLFQVDFFASKSTFSDINKATLLYFYEYSCDIYFYIILISVYLCYIWNEFLKWVFSWVMVCFYFLPCTLYFIYYF